MFTCLLLEGGAGGLPPAQGSEATVGRTPSTADRGNSVRPSAPFVALGFGRGAKRHARDRKIVPNITARRWYNTNQEKPTSPVYSRKQLRTLRGR